jgi:hypothetical protein
VRFVSKPKLSRGMIHAAVRRNKYVVKKAGSIYRLTHLFTLNSGEYPNDVCGEN